MIMVFSDEELGSLVDGNMEDIRKKCLSFEYIPDAASTPLYWPPGQDFLSFQGGMVEESSLKSLFH